MEKKLARRICFRFHSMVNASALSQPPQPIRISVNGRTKAGYGKGGGKGGAKRRYITKKRLPTEASKGDIRRLARRGGVKRISSLIYDTTRTVMKTFLEGVVEKAVVHTMHARRMTVTAMDVVFALKCLGRTLYLDTQ